MGASLLAALWILAKPALVIRPLFAIFATVALTGCAMVEGSILYSDLVFVHENDYPEGTMSVSRSTHYGVPENEKRWLMNAADWWSKSRGKVMVPISIESKPAHGNQPSHTTFMFRAMNPNDPAINNPDVSPVRAQTTYF